MKPHDMMICAMGQLCDECLRRWLNRPAPPSHRSGRDPATIRSHAHPWFADDRFARSSYTASVFWLPIAFPNLQVIDIDPQLEAGHG